MDPVNPIAGNPEALNQTPPISEPIKETPKPETKSGGNMITVVAMALFILLTLSAVAFLYYQNQQLKSIIADYQTTTSPSPQPTGDPTINWKIYSDEGKKYSFKYPQDWYIGTTQDGTVVLNDKLFDPKTVTEPDQYKISFEVISNTQLVDAYTKIPLITTKETESGAKFNIVGQGNKPTFAQTSDQEGKLYRFGIPQTQYQEMFDLILASFKFLNQTISLDNEIKQIVTDHLVSKGYNKPTLKINSLALLGIHKDKYSVGYTDTASIGGGSAEFLLIGKINGQWMIPESGDSNYCNWINTAGLDETTKTLMGPSCN